MNENQNNNYSSWENEDDDSNNENIHKTIDDNQKSEQKIQLKKISVSVPSDKLKEIQSYAKFLRQEAKLEQKPVKNNENQKLNRIEKLIQELKKQ